MNANEYHDHHPHRSTSSNYEEFVFPLLLSLLAGLSTCLGAAIVFCVPSDVLSSSMPFSLSLAGSVMITVSVISILPECLTGVFVLEEDLTTAKAEHENNDLQGASAFLEQVNLSVAFERIASFGFGCCSYWCLSKYIFPSEPTEILDHLQQQQQQRQPLLKKQQEQLHNNEIPFVSSPPTKSSASSSRKAAAAAAATATVSSTNSGRKMARMRRNVSFEEVISADGSKSSTTTISTMNTGGDDSRKAIRGRGRTCYCSVPFSSCWSSSSTTITTTTINRRNIEKGKNDDDHTQDSDSLMLDTTRSLSSEAEEGLLQLSDSASPTKSLTTNTLTTKERQRSWRLAMLLFVSLLCHNFPEGLAVAASTVSSSELGITVAIGIMIHNIPEGIAISVPCIAARPNAPWLAFCLASISGLAEPLGAWIALSVLELQQQQNANKQRDSFLGNILSSVAGIMIMVSVVELYPEAWRHANESHGMHNESQTDMSRGTSGSSISTLAFSSTGKSKPSSFRPNRGKQLIQLGTICGILLMVATELFI